MLNKSIQIRDNLLKKYNHSKEFEFNLIVQFKNKNRKHVEVTCHQITSFFMTIPGLTQRC